MPTFVLKCTDDQCGKTIETSPVCTHSKAIETVCECGKPMVIMPQPVKGVVNGYNAENGYHRETLSYDGNHPG